MWRSTSSGDSFIEKLIPACRVLAHATRPGTIRSPLRNMIWAPSTGSLSPSTSAPSALRLRSFTGNDVPDNSRLAAISTFDRRDLRFCVLLLWSIGPLLKQSGKTWFNADSNVDLFQTLFSRSARAHSAPGRIDWWAEERIRHRNAPLAGANPRNVAAIYQLRRDPDPDGQRLCHAGSR